MVEPISADDKLGSRIPKSTNTNTSFAVFSLGSTLKYLKAMAEIDAANKDTKKYPTGIVGPGEIAEPIDTATIPQTPNQIPERLKSAATGKAPKRNDTSVLWLCAKGP